MENEIRDFKGVWIPKEIWLDDRLSVLDKAILVEIDSLDSTEEGCYASNKYLADFCKCTETKVSTSISKLIKLEYLEVVKFDGRKRYLKSRLKFFYRQTLNNLKADFKKFKDINIVNNKDNNIIRFIKPTLEEVESYCKERNNGIDAQYFIDYYTRIGWVYGKNRIPIKDWKSCIRTWERNKNNKTNTEPEWFDKDLDEGDFFTNEERRNIEQSKTT